MNVVLLLPLIAFAVFVYVVIFRTGPPSDKPQPLL